MLPAGIAVGCGAPPLPALRSSLRGDGPALAAPQLRHIRTRPAGSRLCCLPSPRHPPLPAACAPGVQRSVVLFTTWTFVHATPPMRTVAPVAKPTPVIVTVPPPIAPPDDGPISGDDDHGFKCPDRADGGRAGKPTLILPADGSDHGRRGARADRCVAMTNRRGTDEERDGLRRATIVRQRAEQRCRIGDVAGTGSYLGGCSPVTCHTGCAHRS